MGFYWQRLLVSSAHDAIFVNQQQSECLSVFFGADGAQAVLLPCTSSFFQMWNWEEIEIRGLGTTNLALKCLDVKGAGTVNNTPVQLFTCNGTVAQRWFYTASGQILNPPIGKCLDLSGEGLVSVCNRYLRFEQTQPTMGDPVSLTRLRSGEGWDHPFAHLSADRRSSNASEF